MTNQPRQPNKKDIFSALENSGYLIEQSVAPIIEGAGFLVDTNFHYLDPELKVSREMDIKAYSLKKISRRWFSHHLSITLIISCKANKSPLVFFQRKSSVPPEYMGGDFFMLSNPNKIPGEETEPIDIQDYISLRKFHHYYKISKISTQFCAIGYNEKYKKFETQHYEYESEILPLIKAMDYEMKVVREEELSKDIINIHTFYPIMLLGGNMYACENAGSRKSQLKKSQHVSYLQTYNSGTLKGEFRIDVITQDYLGRLLKQIDLETDEIIRRVNRKRKYLVDVIKKTKKEDKNEN